MILDHLLAKSASLKILRVICDPAMIGMIGTTLVRVTS